MTIPSSSRLPVYWEYIGIYYVYVYVDRTEAPDRFTKRSIHKHFVATAGLCAPCFCQCARSKPEESRSSALPMPAFVEKIMPVVGESNPQKMIEQ